MSNVERIHDTLAELVGFTFIWNVLGEDNQVAYGKRLRLFLFGGIAAEGARRGYTRLRLSRRCFSGFFEPKDVGQFDVGGDRRIDRDGGLGQEAAFGLYQSTWRYIGTSAKLTPALDVHTWIDLIIGPSRFVQVNARGARKWSTIRILSDGIWYPG